MKVESAIQGQSGKPVTAIKPVAGKASGTAVASGTDAFSVQMSEKVKEMIKATSDEDSVRLDKVAAIREQLAKGSYNISGKDVADKILNALKN